MIFVNFFSKKLEKKRKEKRMPIAAQFTIARNRQQPKYLSTVKWMNSGIFTE